MPALGHRCVKHVGSLAEFPHLPPGRYVCESPGHLSAFAVGPGFVEWATAATPSLVGRCPGTPGDLPGVVMAKTFNQYAEHAESSIADLLFRVYRISCRMSAAGLPCPGCQFARPSGALFCPQCGMADLPDDVDAADVLTLAANVDAGDAGALALARRLLATPPALPSPPPVAMETERVAAIPDARAAQHRSPEVARALCRTRRSDGTARPPVGMVGRAPTGGDSLA